MKKKIKDLTEKELTKICKKFETDCEKCPLYVNDCDCKNHYDIIDIYGEEEIEVLQDEKVY